MVTNREIYRTVGMDGGQGWSYVTRTAAHAQQFETLHTVPQSKINDTSKHICFYEVSKVHNLGFDEKKI